MPHQRPPVKNGQIRISRTVLGLLFAAVLALGGLPVPALAEAVEETVVVIDEQPQDEQLQAQDDVTVVDEDDVDADSNEVTIVEDGDNATTEEGSVAIATQEGGSATSYNAGLYDEGGKYPGVYTTKIQPNSAATAADGAAIHFPSINDTTLQNNPTTESPAIIVGAARQLDASGNEIEALGRARRFEEPSTERVAPYSYFNYSVTEQQATDGSMVKKLTGFDGTYVIARIDVSELWNSVPAEQRENTYLHVSQDKNNALLVAVGMDTKAELANKDGRDQWGNISFSNLFTVDSSSGTAYQKKTASYKLSEMYDSNGKDTTTPYFDVIVFSTAGIVAGADAQKEGALNGDIELNFYFDQTADYDPTVNWDPQSTDTTLSARCHAKFYNEDKAKEAGATISRYVVKGSELHLETMVENSDSSSTKTTYWALEKSLEHAYYDQEVDKSATDQGCGRTISLMSEVPVVNNLAIKGASATELKKRTLDVNSFDIQVANNTSPGEGEYTSGLWLENAWLKIADLSNTTGAELAIGNNATMTIETGGKLIIDETCQLEIEWDGATTAPAAEGQPAPTPDVLNNGSLDLRKGGEVQNDGVVTIEGTEGKPYQPGAEKQASEAAKGHGELTICEGATFTNNGCFMPNGALYVQGTLINNGKYGDTIVSQDPDRGLFTYHKGIQSTWKDDVTQQNIIFGGIYVGMDKTWTTSYPKAVLTNNGDILLCPGELVNQGTVKNMPDGAIFLCATDRAIIPIEPDPATPTITTKEVDLDNPVGGIIYTYGELNNQGEIRPAQVAVATNGSLGKIATPGNYEDLFSLNVLGEGKVTGTGYYYKHNLKDATVELRRNAQVLDSVVYDGEAQWFDIVAMVGDRAYDSSSDFTVTYLDPSGNAIKPEQIVNAGTYKVQVKGKTTFRGTVTKTLTVEPATLTEATLSATSFTYNKKTQKPTISSVKAGDLALKASDYTATFSNNNPVNAGTYDVTVTGKDNYTGNVKQTFTINKAANTIKVKGKTAKVRSAKVAKKAQTVKRAKAYKVTKAKGTRTYKLASVSKKKFKKYFAVNKKTGNITVKKGLKKGTYTLKIKVRAAGTANYKARTKTVKCKVNVA